jgi:hypothetical protein
VEKGKTSDIIEFGLRRQLTPLTTISAGAGVVVSKDCQFRIAARFRLSF